MKKYRSEIIIGIIVAVISGLILFFIQKPFESKEKIVIEKEKDVVSPIELIKGISLNSPIELIKERLGAPHMIQKIEDVKVLIYQFKEFSLKIHTKDNETISSLTYLLNDMSKYIEIIPGESKPILMLGKNTFGDFKDSNPKVIKEMSSKDAWLYCDCYFGNPGSYWQYRIGTYNDDSFNINCNEDANNQIDITCVSQCKLNFVSIAREPKDLEVFWHGDFR